MVHLLLGNVVHNALEISVGGVSLEDKIPAPLIVEKDNNVFASQLSPPKVKRHQHCKGL